MTEIMIEFMISSLKNCDLKVTISVDSSWLHAVCVRIHYVQLPAIATFHCGVSCSLPPPSPPHYLPIKNIYIYIYISRTFLEGDGPAGPKEITVQKAILIV